MRMSKRILAMLLAVIMVASVAPMTVMQAAAENITEAISDLGDALAVESEDKAAEPLADESEKAPPVDETGSAEAEEPKQETSAADETAAAEETSGEKATAEGSSAEESEVTSAVTQAARRAPLTAAPEISLGLEGYNTSNNHFEFTNGEFRILQLTDIQVNEDGLAINAKTYQAIQSAILFYNPDLIVFTGDQINGSNTDASDCSKFVTHLMGIMTAANPNIKVAVTMGNHDPKASCGTAFQYTCWKGFSNNFVDVEALSGTESLAGDGNGKVDIYNGSNVAAQVFLFDSQQTRIGGTDDSNYNAIVNWYSSAATKPNLVFQHIILNEIYQGTNGVGTTNGLLKEAASGTAHAISDGSVNKVFLLNEGGPGVQGQLNEGPGPYAYDIGANATQNQFRAMATHNCLGAFFGHEHTNNFGGPVTVDGYTVNFYAGPGITNYNYDNLTGDYNAGWSGIHEEPVPGVRTATLRVDGSGNITNETRSYLLREIEALAAEKRKSNRETGVISGNYPANNSMSTPTVLYKCSANMNSRPDLNQEFGDILAKYVINYATGDMDATNRTVRFTLPTNAQSITVKAYKNSASGTELSMSAHAQIASANGGTVYQASLTDGQSLSGVNDVVYIVSYTTNGVSKEIYGASCVEDIKVPAGYSTWKFTYKKNNKGNMNHTLSSSYCLSLTGDNVYATARALGKVVNDEGADQSYSSGYFNFSLPNTDARNSFVQKSNDNRYALAFHGSGAQQMNGDTYTSVFVMNLEGSGERIPALNDIYIDSGNLTTTNGKLNYGASINFVATDDTDKDYMDNIARYPAIAQGIGFWSGENSSGSHTYGSAEMGDPINASGFWNAESSVAIARNDKNDTGINWFDNYAKNQSLSNVSTTHTNSSSLAANRITAGEHINFDLTSSGGTCVTNGTYLSMMVGTRTQQQTSGTRYGQFVLNPFDLKFHVCDKSNLRAAVSQALQAGYYGDAAVYTTWRDALIAALNILNDAKSVDQTAIENAATALNNAGDAVLVAEIGAGGTAESAPDPTTKYITAINVPPILYTKADGSIITASGGDGLSSTNDTSYDTAISVTTNSGVSNLKLYLVDANDANPSQITLTQSGTTYSGSFPSGKKATLSDYAGAVYYRLEYTANDKNGHAKTFTAYAASYVRERPITKGSWKLSHYHQVYKSIWTTNTYWSGFRFTDTLDVTSSIANRGVGAVVSAFTAKNTESDANNFSAANQGFGENLNEANRNDSFNTSVNGSGGHGVTTNRWGTETNDYAEPGTVAMFNIQTSEKHNTYAKYEDMIGLCDQSDSGFTVRQYLCASFFFDKSIVSDVNKMVGTNTYTHESTLHTGDDSDALTESSTKYNATTAIATAEAQTYSSGTVGTDVTNNAASFNTTYLSFSGGTVNSNKNQYGYLFSKGNTASITFKPKSIPSTASYEMWTFKKKREGNCNALAYYGIIYAIVPVDRTIAHAAVANSLVTPVSKGDYTTTWWNDYRSQVWDAYKTAGNIYSGSDYSSNTITKWNDRNANTYADYTPLYTAINNVCFTTETGSSVNLSPSQCGLGKNGSGVAKSWETDVYYKPSAIKDPGYTSRNFAPTFYTDASISALISKIKGRNKSLYSGGTATEGDTTSYAVLTSKYNEKIRDYAAEITALANALELKPADYTTLDRVSNMVKTAADGGTTATSGNANCYVKVDRGVQFGAQGTYNALPIDTVGNTAEISSTERCEKILNQAAILAGSSNNLISVNYLRKDTVDNYINNATYGVGIPAGLKKPSETMAVGSYLAMYPSSNGTVTPTNFTISNGSATGTYLQRARYYYELLQFRTADEVVSQNTNSSNVYEKIYLYYDDQMSYSPVTESQYGTAVSNENGIRGDIYYTYGTGTGDKQVNGTFNLKVSDGKWEEYTVYARSTDPNFGDGQWGKDTSFSNPTVTVKDASGADVRNLSIYTSDSWTKYQNSLRGIAGANGEATPNTANNLLKYAIKAASGTTRLTTVEVNMSRANGDYIDGYATRIKKFLDEEVTGYAKLSTHGSTSSTVLVDSTQTGTLQFNTADTSYLTAALNTPAQYEWLSDSNKGSGWVAALDDYNMLVVDSAATTGRSTKGEAWYTASTWSNYQSTKTAANAYTGTAYAYQQAGINTATTNIGTARSALVTMKLADYRVVEKDASGANSPKGKLLNIDGGDARWLKYQYIIDGSATVNTDFNAMVNYVEVDNSKLTTDGTLSYSTNTYYYRSGKSTGAWDTAYNAFKTAYVDADKSGTDLAASIVDWCAKITAMNNVTRVKNYNKPEIIATLLNSQDYRAPYDFNGYRYRELGLDSITYGDMVTIGGASKTYGKTWYAATEWDAFETARNNMIAISVVNQSGAYNYNTTYTVTPSQSSSMQYSDTGINGVVRAYVDAFNALSTKLKKLSEFSETVAGNKFTYGTETTGATVSQIANAASLKNTAIANGKVTKYTVSFNDSTGKATLTTNGGDIYTTTNKATWDGYYNTYNNNYGGTKTQSMILADNIAAYRTAVANMKGLAINSNTTAYYDALVSLVNKRAKYDIGGGSYSNDMKAASGLASESGLPSGYSTSGKSWYKATQWDAYAAARNTGAALLKNYSSAFNYDTTYAANTATAGDKQNDINTAVSSLVTAYNNLLDNPKKLSDYSTSTAAKQLQNTSGTAQSTYANIATAASGWNTELNKTVPVYTVSVSGTTMSVNTTGSSKDCYSNRSAWNGYYETFTTYNTANANNDLAGTFKTYETNVANLIGQANKNNTTAADYTQLIKAVNSGSGNLRPKYDIGGSAYTTAMQNASGFSTAAVTGAVLADGTTGDCNTNGATWYTSTWNNYATARQNGAALLGGYSSAFSYAKTYTAGSGKAINTQESINNALVAIKDAYNALVVRKLTNYGDVNTTATFGKTSFADIYTAAGTNDTEMNSGGITVKYYDTDAAAVKTKTVTKYDSTHINNWNNAYDTTANANLAYYNTNKASLDLATSFSGYRTVLSNLTNAWNGKIPTKADYSALVQYVKTIPNYDIGGGGYTSTMRTASLAPVNANNQTYGKTWYNETQWTTYENARNAAVTILNDGVSAVFDAENKDSYSAPTTLGNAADKQAAINSAVDTLINAYNALTPKKLSEYNTTNAGKKLDGASTYSAINSKATTCNTTMNATSVVYKLPNSFSGSLIKTGNTRTNFQSASITAWNTAKSAFDTYYNSNAHADDDLAASFADYEAVVKPMINAWNNKQAQTADYSQLLALVNGTSMNNVAWRAPYDYNGAQYVAKNLGSVNYGDKVTINSASKTYGKTWYVVGNSTSGWTLYESARKTGASILAGYSSDYSYATTYTEGTGITSSTQSDINAKVEAIFNALQALELKQMSTFALASGDGRSFPYGSETAGNTFAAITTAASNKNAVVTAGTTSVSTVTVSDSGAAVTAGGKTIETIGDIATWNGYYTTFTGVKGTDVLADKISTYLTAVANMKAFDDSSDEVADYSELLKLVNFRAKYDIGGSGYTTAMKSATGFTAESGLPGGYNTSGKTWYKATEWTNYAAARKAAAALLKNYSSDYNYSTTYAANTATAASKQADINTALSNLATAYNALIAAPRKLENYGDVNTAATFGKTSFADIYTAAGTNDADMNIGGITVKYYSTSTGAITSKTVTKYDSTHITAWNNAYDTTANANLSYYNTNKASFDLATSFSGYRTVLTNLTNAWNGKVATEADYSGLVNYVKKIPTYDVGGAAYTDAMRNCGIAPLNANSQTYGKTWYNETQWTTYETARNAAVTILNGGTAATFNVDSVGSYAAPAAPGTAAEKQAAINTAVDNLVNAYNALTPKKLSDYAGTWQSASGYSAINAKAAALNTEIQNAQVDVVTVASAPSKTPAQAQATTGFGFDLGSTTAKTYSDTFRTNINTALTTLNTYCTNNANNPLATTYATYLSDLAAIKTYYDAKASNKAAPNYTYLAYLLGENWIPAYAKKGAKGIELFGDDSLYDGGDWYSNWSSFTTAANAALAYSDKYANPTYNSAFAKANNYATVKAGLTTDDQTAVNTAVTNLAKAYYGLTLKTLNDYAGSLTINSTSATGFSNILNLVNSQFTAYTSTVRVRKGFTSADNSASNTADFENYNVYKQTNNAALTAEKNTIAAFSATATLVDNFTAYTNALNTFKTDLQTNMSDSYINTAKYDYLLAQVATWADYDGYTNGTSGNWGTPVGGTTYVSLATDAKSKGIDSIVASHGDTWYSSTTWASYDTARDNAANFLKNISTGYVYGTSYSAGTYTTKQSVTFNSSTKTAQEHINDLAYQIYATRAALAVSATLGDYADSWTAWGTSATKTGFAAIMAFVNNDSNFSWVSETVPVLTVNGDALTSVNKNVYPDSAINAMSSARAAVQAFKDSDPLSKASEFSTALNALKTAYTANYEVTRVKVYTDGWDGIFRRLTTNARSGGKNSSFTVSKANLTTYLTYLFGSGKVDDSVAYAASGTAISDILTSEADFNAATKTATAANQADFNGYVQALYNELNAIKVTSTVKMDNAIASANTEKAKGQPIYDPLNKVTETVAYQYTTASQTALTNAINGFKTAVGNTSAWSATPADFGWHASSGAFNGTYANKILKAAGLTTDETVEQNYLLVLAPLSTASLDAAIAYAKAELYSSGTTVKTFEVLSDPSNGTKVEKTLFTADSIDQLTNATTGALTLAQAKKAAAGSVSLTTSNWLTEQQAIDELTKTLIDETDIANTVKVVDATGTLYGTLANVGGDNGLKYVGADYTYVDAQHNTPMYASDLDAAIKAKLWGVNGPLMSGDNYVAESYYTAESWAAYIAAYNAATIPSGSRTLNATQQATVDALVQALYDARIALAYKPLNTSASFAAAGTAITNAEAKKSETFYLEKYVNDYDLFASRITAEETDQGLKAKKVYSTGETSYSDASALADRLMTVYSTADIATITSAVTALQTYYNNGSTKTMADEQAMINATTALNDLFRSDSATKLTPRMTNEMSGGKLSFGAGADDLLTSFIAGEFDGTTFTTDKLPQALVPYIQPLLTNIYTILNGDIVINSNVTVGGKSMKAYEALNYHTNALYEYCTGTRAQNAPFAVDLRDTLYNFYDTTIVIDSADVLRGSGILGGTPGSIKLFDQTDVTAKKAEINTLFSSAENWPYVFQLNGLTYYPYGEGGTSANPTSVKEKCVEGLAVPAGETEYQYALADFQEIVAYMSANGLSDTTGMGPAGLNKVRGLLNAVGTRSSYYYDVIRNEYGAGDLYAWLMNYAEKTKNNVTYILGNTGSCALPTVNGISNTFAPGWYYADSTTKTNKLAGTSKDPEYNGYYYYQLSSNNEVYGSSHGGWFSDASYNSYISAKNALDAITTTNGLAGVTSGVYTANHIADTGTASGTSYASITENGWTSAAQSALLADINAEQAALCTGIANYYNAIKGLQRLIAYQAYENTYNLIAAAEGRMVAYYPEGSDVTGLTRAGNATLRLYYTDGNIVADKAYAAQGLAKGDPVGGRVYAAAMETLKKDTSRYITIATSNNPYYKCAFSTDLPDHYKDGAIQTVIEAFNTMTKTTDKILTIDRAEEVFKGTQANVTAGCQADTQILALLDAMPLKGADFTSLEKLIYMFMCNSINTGKPASYNVTTNANLGLGALDYVDYMSTLSTNSSTVKRNWQNYKNTLLETYPVLAQLGTTDAALDYKTNPLMQTVADGGYMSHSNGEATNASVSTPDGSTKVPKTTSGTVTTGFSTTNGFYWYDNYSEESLASVIQYMIDKELIKASAIPSISDFTYNWTADQTTNNRSAFFIGTGYFETFKINDMCSNLITLYNGGTITDPDSGRTYTGLKLKGANETYIANLNARMAVADEIAKDWQIYNLASKDWTDFLAVKDEANTLLGYENLSFMFNDTKKTVAGQRGLQNLVTSFGKVDQADYPDGVAAATKASPDNSYDGTGAPSTTETAKLNGSLLYRLLHTPLDATDTTGKPIRYKDISAPVSKVTMDAVNVRAFAAANPAYFTGLTTAQRAKINSGTYIQPSLGGYTMYIYTNQLTPYFVINLQEQLANAYDEDGKLVAAGNPMVDPDSEDGEAAVQYNCSKPEKMAVQGRATAGAIANVAAWDKEKNLVVDSNLANGEVNTETKPEADGTYAKDSSAVVVLKPVFDKTKNGQQAVAYTIVATDAAAEKRTNSTANAGNGNNIQYSSDKDYVLPDDVAATENGKTTITVMVYYQNSEMTSSTGAVLDEGFATSATSSTTAKNYQEVVPTKDRNGKTVYQYFGSSVRSERQKENASANDWLYMETLRRLYFGNVRNWEFVSQTDGAAPIADDPDYNLADMGSFIYVIDPATSDPASLDYQVANEYYRVLQGNADRSATAATAAKTKLVTLLQGSADMREAVKSSKNYHDYGATANWSQTLYGLQNGTLVYVHTLDRWGNRVNRIIVIDKTDPTGPVVEIEGNEAVVNEFDGSGIKTIDVFKYMGTQGSSLYADYHFSRYHTQKAGTTYFEGDTMTITGLEPYGYYTVGAMNNASMAGSDNIQASADGVIRITVHTAEYQPYIYNVSNKPASIANCSDGEDVGVIDFVLNGTDTVILNYAQLTSVISAGTKGNILANKSTTPLNVTTKDNVLELKLVEQGGATEIWTKTTTGVTVTDNGDGTLTWTSKRAFTEGKHNYTVYAKTEDEFEIGGVDFTMSATAKTVVIDLVTTGLGSFTAVYSGGLKKTVSTRAKITVAYGDVLTLTAKPATMNGYTFDFMFWNNKNTERMISTDGVYTFEAVSAAYIQAQFTPNSLSEGSGRFVVYVNEAGNIVDNFEVAEGETYKAPAGPILQDHVFKNWSMTVEQALASDKRTVVITPVYTIGETYTVNIETGNYVVTGSGVYTCENDQRALVNISASAKNGSGEAFSYWLDCDTNEIVSYSRGYAFYAIKNTNLRPVYGEAVTAQPVIRIAAVKFNKTAKKVNFYAERSVPGAYEVIQTGVIVTKAESVGTSTGAFIIGAAGTGKGTSVNTASSGFYTGVVSAASGETVWARGYLIYRDAQGEIQTVYSSIASYTV